MVPTPQLPSQRDTAIWRIMDHLCSHKTAEISTTAVGTAFSSLSSMVHLFIISTPTESHFHKSIHSIIVIFYLRCSSTRKVHRSKVRTKYCSIMVSLILTFPFQETISVQPSLWLISQLQRDSSPHSICPIPSVSGIWEWDHMSQIAIAGTLARLYTSAAPTLFKLLPLVKLKIASCRPATWALYTFSQLSDAISKS